MCLIVLAHAVSDAMPLVLAANRDEAYDRPSLAAAWWEDAPDVIGGRDLLAGGSWLAITRSGRFAAVTNVRDGRAVAARAPSRGALVRDFVLGDDAPLAYVERIALRGGDYAGFHLIAGEAGSELAHYTNDGGEPRLLERGTIFAISNAPRGESWPKTERAAAAMRVALQSSDVSASLMTFLTTPFGGDPRGEIFITSPSNGTRASTVIVVDGAGRLIFEEKTFGRGGVQT
jgi:uncharacterized protein with NRDE domain